MPEAGRPDVPFPVAAIPEDPDWLLAAPRTQAEVTAFFEGLDLVDPGVVPVLAWRPDGEPPADPRAAYNYAALGRKP